VRLSGIAGRGVTIALLDTGVDLRLPYLHGHVLDGIGQTTVHEMPSDSWTDARLDDLAATLRPLPEQVARVATAVEHLTDETKALRADLSQSQRQIAQIGWALSGALIAALIALIVALA